MSLHIAFNKIANRNYICLPKIAILLLLVGANACTKTENLPACTGNCADIVFSGTMFDLSANAPLKGDDIKIYLNPYVAGALIQPNNYIVASGKTGSDGTFTFHAQYDTTKFASATLEVNATIPDGYIQYPQQIDPMAESGPSNIDALIFDPTDLTSFSHLSFVLFQKTLLQIHMHRTTPILYGGYLLLDLRDNNVVGSVNGLIETAANKDTTVSAYTGANVYTIITASREISDTSYASTKDSIKCTKNGHNAIDIYY